MLLRKDIKILRNDIHTSFFVFYLLIILQTILHIAHCARCWTLHLNWKLLSSSWGYFFCRGVLPMKLENWGPSKLGGRNIILRIEWKVSYVFKLRYYFFYLHFVVLLVQISHSRFHNFSSLWFFLPMSNLLSTNISFLTSSGTRCWKTVVASEPSLGLTWKRWSTNCSTLPPPSDELKIELIVQNLLN